MIFSIRCYHEKYNRKVVISTEAQRNGEIYDRFLDYVSLRSK